MVLKTRGLRDQIVGAMTKSQVAIVDQRVDRVLKLLSDQQLIAFAGDQPDTPGTITVESPDLPAVWEHDRVQARVSELERQGIVVTTEERRRTLADMEFQVWVLTICFQD